MPIFIKTTKYLFILIIFLLMILPYATKYAAVYYLEKEKNVDANIKDVSINLITGKLSLEGVHIYGRQPKKSMPGVPSEKIGELHLGVFSVDIDVLALFDKNIHINAIKFQNFNTNLTELDNAWNIGGIVVPLSQDAQERVEEPVKGAQPVGWGYGISAIDFSNIEVDISSQYTDSNVKLNKLVVNDLLSWFPENPAELALDISINGDTFKVNGDVTPFIEEPIIKTRIRLDDIKINPFLKSVKNLPFDEASLALFSDFDLAIALKKESIELTIDGSYGLKELALKESSREIKLGEMRWVGKQRITLPKLGAKTIQLDGLLTMEDVDVVDKTQNLHVRNKGIALKGKYDIQLDEKSKTPHIVASAALTLKELSVDTLDGKVTLLSFDKWELTKIDVKHLDKIAIQTSAIHKLVLLKGLENKKLPALVQFESLLLNHIHYQPDDIKINNVELRHLHAEVRLNSQGEIPVLALAFPNKDAPEDANAGKQPAQELPATSSGSLKQKSPNKKSPKQKIVTEKPTGSSNKIGIAIEEIFIDSDSSIRFIDKSMTPVFDTKIHDLKLSIKDINSKAPKQASKIDFNLKIDEYAKFMLKGTVTPFSEKLNAKLIANLSALELAPFSSYAGKYAGLNLKRGTLDLKANIKIKDDILDVKNSFYLNQLNLESDDSEIADNIFKDMPMPLDLTLDVLRDKQNIIKLDIPIKGNIKEPDFKLQDVYNTAMLKAVKFAATHYLLQAVQPLGLVLTATDLLGKAMAPRFDPLIFDLGSAKISQTNKQHIKKLAKILQEKDKLRLTICGNATGSDWRVIQKLKSKTEKASESEKTTDVKQSSKTDNVRTQILLRLARDRTKRVKKHFVDVYKIAPNRLFGCNGKIVKDKKNKPAVPSVEITL